LALSMEEETVAHSIAILDAAVGPLAALSVDCAGRLRTSDHVPRTALGHPGDARVEKERKRWVIENSYGGRRLAGREDRLAFEYLRLKLR
jgi:hypothetical protein